jgi:poly-gamma-glutamate capsule biosynthesis protein CapA/YwtB (metallophosphatase superfamily)
MAMASPRFTAALFLATALFAAAQSDRGDLRVLLVGQALVKKDLRAVVPESVAQAKTYLAGADVVFTNLEAAIAPAGFVGKPRSETAVYGSPDVLDCLKAMGFNLLSLANNHAFDLLESGLLATRSEVARVGFSHAGTGANADQAAGAALWDTRGGKVALVAMASGGIQLTPEAWAGPGKAGVNFLEVKPDGSLNAEHRDRILQAVRAAAAKARTVIVYQHNHYWGEARGLDGPPGRERRIDRFDTPAWMERWARQLVDAGATLFVAHGNPALHGIEIYRGRPILYGLGNYIFQSTGSLDRYGPLTWQSALVDVTFAGGRLSGVRMKPLVLAMEGAARGAPFLAQGGEAAAILGRLADLSRRYGTEVRIEGDSAEVVLK